MDESANHSSFVPSGKWAEVPSYSQLSPKAMACLTGAVNGQNNEQIASTLGCRPKSVGVYLTRAFKRIATLDEIGESMPGRSNRQQVAELLIQHGYFEPEAQS